MTKQILGAIAALVLSVSAAQAVSLTIEGAEDGTTVNLPGHFNLDDSQNAAPGWTLGGYQAIVPAGHGYNGSSFLVIDGSKKDATNGLRVTGPARVTFTYLGYEAGYTNRAVVINDTVFLNKGTGASSFGALWSGLLGKGLLDFAFASNTGGSIANDGGTTDVAVGNKQNIAIAYKLISATSAIVLFDDSGAGPDRDFDDLGLRIDVAAVPVPAAGAMLLLGLGGLAAAARRRKTA